MRYSRIGAVLAMALAVGSCTDNPVQSPTALPDAIRFGKVTGLPCDAATSRTVKAQQADLFEGAVLRQAQTLWALVETACVATNPDAANGPLLEYTRYVLAQWPANVLSPRIGDKETNFLGHLDTTFPYVGYPAPALPLSSVGGPLNAEEGALGVIAQSDVERELRAPDAALTLPIQDVDGDSRAHLFAIYPDPTACGVGNLARIGLCYEVKSFPTVAPRWSPEIKVGVCSHVPVGEVPGGNIPALGHLINGQTEIAGNLAYPAECGVHVSQNTGSWTGGVKEIVTRLGWLGQRTFGVKTAYASHSGLGGIGGFLSPWGGVDLQVFNAPVAVGPNVIGAFPVAPAVGGWDPASFATPPGSIVVGSVGGYSSPLIVMSQAGGACTKNCGGLLLKGNLFSASGAPATYGRYQITFVAIEDAPGVKEAPFILTDSNGNELGRLSFVTRSGVNQLVFNYNSKTGAGVVVGGWQRNIPQTFKFVVNLNTGFRAVTLYVGTQTTGTTAPFRSASAANLASISFDSRGIDSGVMGWDDIAVERLSDK